MNCWQLVHGSKQEITEVVSLCKNEAKKVGGIPIHLKTDSLPGQIDIFALEDGGI